MAMEGGRDAHPPRTEGGKMKPRLARLCVLMTLALLALPALARAADPVDPVTQWDAIATRVLTGSSAATPPLGGQAAAAVPHLAMVHAAIFDAVNSIDPRYEPYLGRVRAKRSFSQDMAVAAAAHRVLVDGGVVGTPAQHDALVAIVDPAYDAAKAAVADGPAKAGGIATGEAAAWAVIAARTDDGRFVADPFPVGPPDPGVWQLTPPGFVNDPGAWLRNVTPFVFHDLGRFGTRGPNRVTGHRYAQEFNEVKSLGELGSTDRTGDQTDAALFWGEVNAVATWANIIRTLAPLRTTSTVETARFYALIYLTSADEAIATWKDKARWLFWRPVTAIPAADNDGNPDTAGQAGWTPLITTPPYPEHPSGLAALAAAHTTTLRELFGTDDVAFTGVNGAGRTRSYTSLSQVVDEIVDARVWSGVHFRTADVQAAQLGRAVARARRKHHPILEPLHDR
jgi:hypothetical protein